MIKWFLQLFRKHRGGLILEDQDPRDFELGGAPYEPKHVRTNNADKLFPVKNQEGQNTCVCESGSGQKEPDEGTEIDPQDGAIELRKRKKMTSRGTSLSAWQKMLVDRGIAEKGFLPNNYNVSWSAFSNPKLQTKEINENAGKHKTLSYFKTGSINQIIRQLDNGRTGQSGMMWYTGYTNLKYPYILTPFEGQADFGHAFQVVDYDKDYLGKQVIKCRNSWGKEWGDNGYFYVRIPDFARIAYFTYFNTDLPKNVLKELTRWQNKAVLEIGGPKVYLIQGEEKRHIPDEAIMWMLNITPDKLVRDDNNVLPEVKEGQPVSIDEIPGERLEKVKYFVQMSKEKEFIKNRFSPYFPDLFN